MNSKNIMGVREKVALLVTVIVFLGIACTLCMPRSAKKSALKQYYNNLRKSKLNATPKVLPKHFHKHIGIPKHDVINIVPRNKPIGNVFNFPETEYPQMSNTFQTPTSNLYEEDNIFKNTKNNKPINDALSKHLDNLRKEAKLKRKFENAVNGHKETNSNLKPKSNSDTDPFCFKDFGTFPDVKYPQSISETWMPNFWNYMPYIDKKEIADDFKDWKTKLSQKNNSLLNNYHSKNNTINKTPRIIKTNKLNTPPSKSKLETSNELINVIKSLKEAQKNLALDKNKPLPYKTNENNISLHTIDCENNLLSTHNFSTDLDKKSLLSKDGIVLPRCRKSECTSYPYTQDTYLCTTPPIDNAVQTVNSYTFCDANISDDLCHIIEDVPNAVKTTTVKPEIGLIAYTNSSGLSDDTLSTTVPNVTTDFETMTPTSAPIIFNVVSYSDEDTSSGFKVTDSSFGFTTSSSQEKSAPKDKTTSDESFNNAAINEPVLKQTTDDDVQSGTNKTYPTAKTTMKNILTDSNVVIVTSQPYYDDSNPEKNPIVYDSVEKKATGFFEDEPNIIEATTKPPPDYYFPVTYAVITSTEKPILSIDSFTVVATTNSKITTDVKTTNTNSPPHNIAVTHSIIPKENIPIETTTKSDSPLNIVPTISTTSRPTKESDLLSSYAHAAVSSQNITPTSCTVSNDIFVTNSYIATTCALTSTAVPNIKEDINIQPVELYTDDTLTSDFTTSLLKSETFTATSKPIKSIPLSTEIDSFKPNISDKMTTTIEPPQTTTGTRLPFKSITTTCSNNNCIEDFKTILEVSTTTKPLIDEVGTDINDNLETESDTLLPTTMSGFENVLITVLPTSSPIENHNINTTLAPSSNTHHSTTKSMAPGLINYTKMITTTPYTPNDLPFATSVVEIITTENPTAASLIAASKIDSITETTTTQPFFDINQSKVTTKLTSTSDLYITDPISNNIIFNQNSKTIADNIYHLTETTTPKPKTHLFHPEVLLPNTCSKIEEVIDIQSPNSTSASPPSCTLINDFTVSEGTIKDSSIETTTSKPTVIPRTIHNSITTAAKFTTYPVEATTTTTRTEKYFPITTISENKVNIYSTATATDFHKGMTTPIPTSGQDDTTQTDLRSLKPLTDPTIMFTTIPTETCDANQLTTVMPLVDSSYCTADYNKDLTVPVTESNIPEKLRNSDSTSTTSVPCLKKQTITAKSLFENYYSPLNAFTTTSMMTSELATTTKSPKLNYKDSIDQRSKTDTISISKSDNIATKSKPIQDYMNSPTDTILKNTIPISDVTITTTNPTQENCVTTETMYINPALILDPVATNEPIIYVFSLTDNTGSFVSSTTTTSTPVYSTTKPPSITNQLNYMATTARNISTGVNSSAECINKSSTSSAVPPDPKYKDFSLPFVNVSDITTTTSTTMSSNGNSYTSSNLYPLESTTSALFQDPTSPIINKTHMNSVTESGIETMVTNPTADEVFSFINTDSHTTVDSIITTTAEPTITSNNFHTDHGLSIFDSTMIAPNKISCLLNTPLTTPVYYDSNIKTVTTNSNRINVDVTKILPTLDNLQHNVDETSCTFAPISDTTITNKNTSPKAISTDTETLNTILLVTMASQKPVLTSDNFRTESTLTTDDTITIGAITDTTTTILLDDDDFDNMLVNLDMTERTKTTNIIPLLNGKSDVESDSFTTPKTTTAFISNTSPLIDTIPLTVQETKYTLPLIEVFDSASSTASTAAFSDITISQKPISEIYGSKSDHTSFSLKTTTVLPILDNNNQISDKTTIAKLETVGFGLDSTMSSTITPSFENTALFTNIPSRRPIEPSELKTFILPKSTTLLPPTNSPITDFPSSKTVTTQTADTTIKSLLDSNDDIETTTYLKFTTISPFLRNDDSNSHLTSILPTATTAAITELKNPSANITTTKSNKQVDEKSISDDISPPADETVSEVGTVDSDYPIISNIINSMIDQYFDMYSYYEDSSENDDADTTDQTTAKSKPSMTNPTIVDSFGPSTSSSSSALSSQTSKDNINSSSSPNFNNFKNSLIKALDIIIMKLRFD